MMITNIKEQPYVYKDCLKRQKIENYGAIYGRERYDR